MLGRGSQSCIRTGNKASQFPRRAAAKRIEFLLSTISCNFMFVSSCRPFVLLPTKPFVRLLRNCPLSHPTSIFHPGPRSCASAFTAQVSGELSTASAPVVRGDREDLFLRTGQVLNAARQEGLGRGDPVQRLPHQLDQAVLGHETGSKHVMEGAPGRL